MHGFPWRIFCRPLRCKDAVKHTPAGGEMLELGRSGGAGDGCYPRGELQSVTALYWLVSGRTVGGMATYDDSNCLPRDVALELWTAGSAWFSKRAG